MLYKLSGARTGLGTLEPVPFLDVSRLQQKERDRENLYTLNRAGDLVIFELKRGVAGEDAVLQAIGYAQRAGRWVFGELQLLSVLNKVLSAAAT